MGRVVPISARSNRDEEEIGLGRGDVEAEDSQIPPEPLAFPANRIPGSAGVSTILERHRSEELCDRVDAVGVLCLAKDRLNQVCIAEAACEHGIEAVARRDDTDRLARSANVASASRSSHHWWQRSHQAKAMDTRGNLTKCRGRGGPDIAGA
jgi:hypothetical protein